MAIMWMDGFEQYDPSSMPLGTSYASSIAFTLVTGRFSGKAVKISGAVSILRKVITSTNYVTLGCALNLTSGGIGKVFGFVGNTSTIDGWGISVFVQAGGLLQVNRGYSVSSNVLGVSSKGIKFGVWQFIEIEFVRHQTAGSVNIYVDGELVLAVSGVNTGTDANVGPINTIDVSNNSSADFLVDDLYVTDTSTRLGECSIITLSPNADTAQKDFASSTGSDNYACVDELPANGDTDYVSTSTAGKKDLYGLSAFATAPSAIKAVAMNVIARKTASGFRTMKTELVSGASAVSGSEAALSTTYSELQTTHVTDPATSAAWTQAAVEALKIGMSTVA